ncbi:alpha/beta fold hydrolase [Parafrigoribacterium soli]|uniref:alpha/beta fold hydrolase n=1 Tax=Parafrigoribacterium soli TaxID=3144663 RepID=UPI0032EE58A0
MSAEYLVADRGARSIRGVRSRSTLNRVAGLQLGVTRLPHAGARVPARSFVLVHGIGVSSRYFRPLAAELAAAGDVFLIDLPGYGFTPNPHRRVSIQEHADVLAGFLELEGIPDPVLVGHSMGTQVVSRLAVDQPEITDRLVLLAPTTNPAERTLPTQLRLLLADLPGESPAANLIVATDYLFRCGIPYFLSQVPNLLDDHMEERLPGVQAKTLVVRGTTDPIVPRDWAASVTALIPDAELRELPGAHVIMYSRPREVAAMIVEHGSA